MRTASTGPNRTSVPEDEGVLRVSLLGRFEISVGSSVVGEEGWRLRKAAGLVKLLALALEPEAGDFRYLVLRGEQLFLYPDGALQVDVDAFAVVR